MFRGQRIKLAKGRENEPAALKRFHELMAQEAVATSPESPDATVASLCEQFLDWSHRNNKPPTYDYYRFFLQDFCNRYATLRVVELKPFHVTRWLDSHTDTWNQSSRRCAIACVKRVMNWACDEGYIAASPIRKLRKPPGLSREKVLTVEEDQSILNNTDQTFRLVLLALRQTGARPGELASVQCSDFDPSSETWVLRKHKTGEKTGKPRIIYLTPCVVTVSKILQAKHRTGPLFLNSRGVAWTSNAIRCRMRRLREKLKLDQGVVAYAYRHTFATRGLVNGVSIAAMSELLGHCDTKMVSMHYGHLNQHADHLRQAALRAVRTPSNGDV
jgi:integrase